MRDEEVPNILEVAPNTNEEATNTDGDVGTLNEGIEVD